MTENNKNAEKLEENLKPGEFDIERMKLALSQESIIVPMGLSREEKMKFILSHA